MPAGRSALVSERQLSIDSSSFSNIRVPFLIRCQSRTPHVNNYRKVRPQLPPPPECTHCGSALRGEEPNAWRACRRSSHDDVAAYGRLPLPQALSLVMARLDFWTRCLTELLVRVFRRLHIDEYAIDRHNEHTMRGSGCFFPAFATN